MLMHCLEWWLYEIAGFLAGVISEVELGAQSVVYELAAIAYMVTPFHCSFLVVRMDQRNDRTAMYANVILVWIPDQMPENLGYLSIK